MIRAFYTGTTGAIEHQKKMAVSSNNMANTNTNGYKSERLTFQELLYQRMRMPDNFGIEDREFNSEEEQLKMEKQVYNENKLRVGIGGRGNESALSMTQGSFETTGASLDLMIEGQGFFAIEGRDGEMYYTKEGALKVSNEDDDRYLVTSDGGYVLDGNYDRILLPPADEDVSFIPSYMDTVNPNEISIGLFSCPNVYGLGVVGQNKFLTTDFSGEMFESPETIKLVNRGLEMSNVNLGEEMVRVIEAQRAFQSNLTVIRTADEIESYTNQLRT